MTARPLSLRHLLSRRLASPQGSSPETENFTRPLNTPRSEREIIQRGAGRIAGPGAPRGGPKKSWSSAPNTGAFRALPRRHIGCATAHTAQAPSWPYLVRRSSTRACYADIKEWDIRDIAMASRATLALGRGRPRCGSGCGPTNQHNLFYPEKTDIY